MNIENDTREPKVKRKINVKLMKNNDTRHSLVKKH